jgi:PleD family two-component response regulator
MPSIAHTGPSLIIPGSRDLPTATRGYSLGADGSAPAFSLGTTNITHLPRVSPSRGVAKSLTGIALLACADDWMARALDSVLRPAGYGVVHVLTGGAVRPEAARARPDVVVLIPPLPDRDAEQVCRELRRDRVVTPNTPIIGISGSAATRADRLRWLRAGAWDFIGFPIDAEELQLKLGGYVEAKRAADEAAVGGLVDDATGLYTALGLRRRLPELVAEALRLHTALACVVFGPDPQAGAEAVAGARAGLRAHLARLLRAHARLSDAIGWWSETDFVVLAPSTDAEGAEQLVRRLVSAIESAPPEAGAPLGALAMRAGYYALTDVNATPVEPDALLAGATAALALARQEPSGPAIRRFESGP